MDSDLLRLILLALGVILVVGIYLVDRYRKFARRRPRAVVAHQHIEPTIEGGDEDEADEQADVLDLRAEDRVKENRVEEDEPLPAGEFVGEPVVRHRWNADAVDSDSESQLSMELEFSAQGEGDYMHLDPALMDEIPRLIIQVILMNKGEPMGGQVVRDALDTVDMRFGEMNIYHRENDRGQVLFSLASVVEPGSFPEDRKADFTTPGVVLFTQLPGVQDGLSIYSDMLFTAERLAALLDAELYDETRSALTKQTIEHTREKILEHRRKVQLLRSQRH